MPDNLVLPPYSPRRERCSMPRTTCSIPSGILAAAPLLTQRGTGALLDSVLTHLHHSVQLAVWFAPCSRYPSPKSIERSPGRTACLSPRQGSQVAEHHPAKARKAMLNKSLLPSGLAPPPWRALPQPGSQRCSAGTAPQIQAWQWHSDSHSPCRSVAVLNSASPLRVALAF